MTSNYILNGEADKFLNINWNAKDIAIVHVNCRSLKRNFDGLESFIGSFSHPLTAICVTETWLSSTNDTSFGLPGYSLVSKPRLDKGGGGIGIYINNHCTFKVRNDACITKPHLECLFIETICVNKPCLLIGCVYRPPNSDVKLFNIEFDMLLNTLMSKREHTVIIAGDFNLDLIEYTKHPPTELFLNNLIGHSLFPSIRNPTRIATNSATLLDNLFTNCLGTNLSSAIVYNDLSDHLPIILRMTGNTQVRNKTNLIPYRLYNPEAFILFNDLLTRADWSPIYSSMSNSTDLNLPYLSFSKIFMNAFELSFPLRTPMVCRKLSPRQPWMTECLVKNCRKKSKLYRRFCQTKLPAHELAFKTYRNNLKSNLVKAKKLYYYSEFNAASGDMNKTWKLIKRAMNADPYIKSPDTFLVNNKTVTDKMEIACAFNNCFASTGSKLASSIINVTSHYTDYLRVSNPGSIVLYPTDCSEVVNIINALPNKKSCGHDGIPANVVKSAVYCIASHLSNLINYSFDKGFFPDPLKIGKICPIYKAGEQTNVANYRPISLLPLFSKIYEKAIYLRLSSFFAVNNILIDNQYGFRNKHSAYMAVLKLYDEISIATDDNEFALAVYLDLAKAFDTVDMHILCSKLYHYGVRGVAFDLLKSYLTNRKQFVLYDGSNSNIVDVHSGVPQGSILGPLLFLVYINDINNCSDILKLFLFADDTTALHSDTNLDRLISTMNSELHKLANWLKANKLSLNVTKTHYMLFGFKNIPLGHYPITLDGINLERVKFTKFLGITIDDKLSWSRHITNIGLKVSQGLGILYRLRQHIPLSILHILYQTLILPHLTYCAILWGGAYPTTLGPLLVLQKKALRVITFSDYCAPSTPLFLKFGFLRISDIYTYQILIFMFLVSRSELPSSCLRYFSINPVPTHNTRAVNYFKIASYRTNIRKKSISITGPITFNALPVNLQNAICLSSFKRDVKKYLSKPLN